MKKITSYGKACFTVFCVAIIALGISLKAYAETRENYKNNVRNFATENTKSLEQVGMSSELILKRLDSIPPEKLKELSERIDALRVELRIKAAGENLCLICKGAGLFANALCDTANCVSCSIK